jgi:hypothetical protein
MLVPKNAATANAIAFTSGGEKAIDVDAYDAFLLYGIAPPFVMDSSRFYSRAVFERALNDMAKNTLSYPIIRMLRTVTRKPIFVGHRPLPAASRKDSSQDLRDYNRGLEMLNEAVYAKVDAVMLPQPSETIVNGNSTLMKFTQGSKRLDVGEGNDGELHTSEDVDHMNDVFGSMWLKENFGALEDLH